MFSVEIFSKRKRMIALQTDTVSIDTITDFSYEQVLNLYPFLFNLIE